ncbi:MAG: rRNA maturation RNase YbeY [Pseudobdellovibrionaceae bacterium]
MKYNLLNHSSVKMPEKFILAWLKSLEKELLREKVVTKKDLKKDLTVVLISSANMRKLNFEFRNKNYATDVLSFTAVEEESLGELALCPQVLKKQAKEHKLTLEHELGYMLIHGVLHLLGYDHEKSKKEAKIMFTLQDRIFDRLLELH